MRSNNVIVRFANVALFAFAIAGLHASGILIDLWRAKPDAHLDMYHHYVLNAGCFVIGFIALIGLRYKLKAMPNPQETENKVVEDQELPEGSDGEEAH